MSRARILLSMLAIGVAGLLLLARPLEAAPVAGTGAAPPASPPPGLKQVIIVFKTHFDIGYTDLAVNVVQRYRTTMIDKALEVLDHNRDLPPEQHFVWTIPGWPMHKILEDWPGQTPERQQRVRQAFKEGRFVVHALPFSMHTELLEAEDLVRGLGYSSRLTRELGLPLPRDAKMTDVPEHTRMLATLLHHAGIEFMHIGCNGSSTPLGVPPLYWWQGPDGSRVLTMYSAHYGTDLLPPPDWPYHTWLALIHTGDNHGPPRPEEVKKLLDQAAHVMPTVSVRIGRLSDFADAILAEKPDLPVVKNDSTDTWIHGPMSDPAGAKIARTVRPLIPATEALNTELRGWGVPIADAAPTVAAAYEQSLLYGEHTWGGSIGWLKNKLSFGDEFLKKRAAGDYQRSESSWAEHTAYIEKARDLITPIHDQNLRALAQGVGVEGGRVVVFNPLPWKRDGVVSIPPAEPGKGPALFVARDVPPMGYRTFKADEITQPPSGNLRGDAASATLESDAFKAVLDASRGTVRSLIDKRSGRELIDSSSAVGFGQFLYERFDQNRVFAYCDAYNREGRKRNADFNKPGLPPADAQPYRSAAPAGFNLRFEQSPVTVAAVMDAAAGNGVPAAITTRLVLYAGQPYADLEITVHDKPADPWPEAGWLCLPFKVDRFHFRLGRLGSILDPAHEVLAGANHDIFSVNTGLTVTDGEGRGVGLCPMDHPLVSLGRPGCWRFSPQFVAEKPTVFVNLFNNQWNTNFRLWNSGTWTSRVRIWAVDRDSADAGLITPSLEARYPLQAAAADGPQGTLPPAQRGLEVSRRGVSVTAFGRNPDGPGTVLRFWELAGESGRCHVRLPAGLDLMTLQPVNLRGELAGSPIPVSAGEFDFELHAFAPASFVLTAKP